MTASRDIFGEGLLKYIKAGEHDELLERDDGTIFFVYNGEYFTPYNKWAFYDRQAVKYASGRVLDIGCGAGRHGIYLQKKGCDVTGIDTSPLAVKISKKRGLKKVRRLAIEKISPSMGKFDTVIMLGHNFGLFQNSVKLKKILKILDKMTAPDAVIITGSMDPHRLSSDEEREYQKRNVKKGLMPGHVRTRFLMDSKKGPWFDYLFVSKSEMKQMLEGTPWKVKKFFGGLMPTYAAVLEKRRIII
jgi:2-polyprenyl-3-methyl-5-hydroxy-6-metoxy-1,4-benzoquinol methylase